MNVVMPEPTAASSALRETRTVMAEPRFRPGDVVLVQGVQTGVVRGAMFDADGAPWVLYSR